MEMVKVDVQKLQLLNDRIAQTIDALNQVRLSVHGIQHSSQTAPWGTPYGAPAYGVSPYGLQQQPSYGAPFPPSFAQVSPFGQFAPFSPYGAGIQHTTGYPTGYQTGYPTGFQQPGYTTGFTPYGTPVQPGSFTRVAPWTNGLSHTSGWEPRMSWMS
jgi:hypothetical protein